MGAKGRAGWVDGLLQAGGAGGTGQARHLPEGSGPGALIQEPTLTDPSCIQTP